MLWAEGVSATISQAAKVPWKKPLIPLDECVRIHFKLPQQKNNFFLDKHPLFQLAPPAGYQNS